MNKKELAKLLFQHKDIKSLFESRQFDASTLKKVISEEIMRENEEESGFTDIETVQARENEAEMKELQVSLNLAQDHLKAFQSDYLKAKERFIQAKVDGDKPAQSSERGVMAQAKTFKKEEQERIDKIEAQIAYLKSLGVAASKTSTEDDDDYVSMAADTVAKNIKDATNKISAAQNDDELKGISRDVTTSNSGELAIAQKAVQAAVAKDKESPSSSPPVEEEPPSEAPEEETLPQPPAAPGWKNAKSAARAKVTDATTIDQIKYSLASADAFRAFWGVKGEIDSKMAQAKGLFDNGYFAKRIEELKNKATEDNKGEVAEEAANLAATVMGYSEFLNNMMDKQPDFQPPEMDFPQAIPTTEEEFNRSFIQPLVKIQEPTDASVDKDGLKEEQYVELFTTNAANSDVLKSITEKDLQVFGGWYIMSRQSKALNEETDPDAEPLNYLLERYGAFTDFWSDKKGPEFVSKDIKNSIKKRSKIKGLDPRLKATLAGIQTLIDSGQIAIPDSITIGEDPNKEQVRLVTKEVVQDVIQNTPEVDPAADGDQSPLATEEMDAAWATTLDIFFGKSREYSSFMRQFLLKNQASMLYGMIDVLGQITTGGAGGEELSLSREKTQVKQKEQPAAPPAAAEKEANPPKTDTTTTDTSADDEETETTTAVLPESLEEQVINEIFGMFGGKDNEDKEIKFSPKSTSLMRQDLEAMVDLLRSLKTDIGQYKKYSTSSSVDPRFDGSTLKRAMDAKLKVVQQSIAHLTKVIDLEVQSQKDQLKADGAQAAQDSVKLQEASGSDRKVRIAEVERVYNEMRRQYLKGLKVSLSKNQPNEAKAGAKAMKDYVMSEETFMSYFPSNIITSSGGVMTLGAAHESMVAIIAPFIETIRDIVTITKTQKVSESNLQQAIGNLVMISDSIESMFKVPSLIDREFMKKYIEAAKQNPENQPLTDEKGTFKTGNQDTSKTANTGGNYFKNFSEFFSKIKNWFISKELVWPKFSALFKAFRNSNTTLPTPVEIDWDSMSTELDQLTDDDAAVAWLQDLKSNGEWLETLDSRQIPPLIKFSQKLKDSGNLTENAGAAGVVSKLDELGLQITVEQFNSTLNSFEGSEKGLIKDTISQFPKESSSFIYHFINGTYVSAGEKNGEEEEDSESTTPSPTDQYMSLRLGYDSPQELEDNFKPQFEKIIQKLDLKFRDIDDPDEDNPVSAIDYSSGLFLDIAKLVAKSTAPSGVQEGFGEKIKSWNQSRVAKKDFKNRLKLAKQIVKQSFPTVSTEAGLGEDSIVELVREFIESFADDSSDAIKTLMKALGDNKGDIPKTLAKLKTEDETSAAPTDTEVGDESASADTIDQTLTARDGLRNRSGLKVQDGLAEALRPIIEKMLKEHYNH